MAACAFYAGAAPFFPVYPGRVKQVPFFRHHYEQAMGVFLLLLLVVLVFVLAVAALSYLMVFQRPFQDQFHPEGYAMSLTRKLFLCWVVFWVYGGVLALLGSVRTMPIAFKLGHQVRLRQITVSAVLTGYLLLAGLVPITVHSLRFVRQDATPGKVYLLYEDVNRFPRWMFTLGFYRMSLAAERRFGAGSVVALRLTEATIKRAVNEGVFVFIGSHGMQRGLLLQQGFVGPEDIQAMGVNPGLRFVYLTSCDSGVQEDAWKKAFASARVITYPRLTTVLEHLWWMWFRGPAVIRALPD